MRRIPLRDATSGVLIPVLVVPGASPSEVTGIHGNRLRMRVAGPPHKGQANRQAAELLRELFGVSAVLAQGRTDRRKLFLLEGLERDEVPRILDTLPSRH